jgi:membrane protein YqaA with SNARE-associated domain
LVLHWADTRYGVPALFGLSVAEASFFPIPPDPLLLALCLGAPRKAFRFAAVVTVGSVTGGLIGYAIGAVGWQALEGFFFAWVPGFSPAKFADVQALYDRWDFWAVFIAGLTPIPYKVFTISAGVFSIDLPVFVLASVASRGLRFFLIAALIRAFGQPIGRFIDRYFNALMWLLGALLVGGFVFVRFLL